MSGPDLPDGGIDDIMATIRRIVADAPPPPLGEIASQPPRLDAPAPAVIAATAPADSPTIDAFLRSMLEPMLRQWLDAHLPEIVERATEAEIRRLTKTSD